uniref:Peptidase S1 domain-containing protein n=1 Tax=Megaselia scalaris TaxID=36166 RepID=T1GK96_MEGSC
MVFKFSNGVTLEDHRQATGKLIIVLTSAHCTQRDGHSPDFVRFISSNLSLLNGFDFKIISIIVHPDYDPNEIQHDIAILVLDKYNPLPPACLFQTLDPPFREVLALGYGATEFGGKSSTALHRVELDLYTNSECQNFYTQETIPITLTDYEICAGDIFGERDTCQGDSGGPIIVKIQRQLERIPYIIGLTSFGDQCASGKPG